MSNDPPRCLWALPCKAAAFRDWRNEPAIVIEIAMQPRCRCTDPALMAPCARLLGLAPEAREEVRP